MSSTRPWFVSSGAVDSSMPSRPLPKPSRRRDKPQLSCNLCRRRRLKCDRAQPCGTCAHKGLHRSCTYVNSTPSRAEGPVPQRPANIRDRIAELEKLVITMMHSQSLAHPVEAPPTGLLTTPSTSTSGSQYDIEAKESSDDSSQLTEGFGQISLGDSGAEYDDSDLWAAILDGINNLKDCFDDFPPEEREESIGKAPRNEGPELLFRRDWHMDRREIFTEIPERSFLDRALAKCFNDTEIGCMLVHKQTFFKEYERFWESPEDMPFLWIGFLFGALCMSCLFDQYTDQKSDTVFPSDTPAQSKARIEKYRMCTVQCLVLGSYTKGSPYSLETLLIYFHIEHFLNKTTQAELWILLGIVLRLAFRMGYHRDASRFPQIPALQAEMRRRIWGVIFQLDVSASTQLGLPRMIRESQVDTAEPRNILDEDLHEGMTELPPPRTDVIHSQVLYLVAKNRLFSIYGAVSDMTTSPQRKTHADVMKLDKVLHTVYKSIPSVLHMRPMSKAIFDNADIITRRLFISLLYHKIRCVLHRKYLIPARNDKRYSYSRSECIEGALEILEYQKIVNQEMASGGRLFKQKWKISMLVRQEFLLATTVLCLDLYQEILAVSPSPRVKSTADIHTREIVARALIKSYMIWLHTRELSRESEKAVQVLKFVLGKARNAGIVPSADFGTAGATSSLLTESFLLAKIDPGTPSSGYTQPLANPSRLPSSMDRKVTDSQTVKAFYISQDESMGNWFSDLDNTSIDRLLDISQGWPEDFEFPE